MGRTLIEIVIGLIASSAVAQAQPAGFDLPPFDVHHGSGIFTGFNSVDLQTMFVVRKQAAIRSQISPRGGQKPCLGRLPNGVLLATQKHDGVIALYRSTNNGLTWSGPQVVKVSGREVLPGRAAIFSALSDGTLLLGYKAAMYRSTDEGVTWQECSVDASFTFEGERFQLHWGENSGPHELSDGTVVCGCYCSVRPGHGQAWLIRSTDRGRTWGDITLIADHCSEANFAVLPGDRLFVCLRQGTQFRGKWAGEGGVVLSIASSNDRGRTWTEPRRILGRAQSPGFPIRLSDGRMIIVYTHRQSPHGVQAIASVDEGRTWDVDHPVWIAWNSFDAYCGHPRSLVLSDDSIVSGFYVRAFHSPGGPGNDVVGHCVRWRAPRDWPTNWPPKSAPLSVSHDERPVLSTPQPARHRLYTGYNSLDLQEIFFTEKRPVIRSQIGPRGGHKPCLARLPDGDLTATQLLDGFVALCRSTDGGVTWSRPRNILSTRHRRLSRPARQLAALTDGTLLLAQQRMYRSTDGGNSWEASPLKLLAEMEGQAATMRFGDSSGPIQLASGQVLCTAHATFKAPQLHVRVADDATDGKWRESTITWNNAPDAYNLLAGSIVETEAAGGDAVELSSATLVDALNADTNDVLDIRISGAASNAREAQFYYATKEHDGYPGPQLIVEFQSGRATKTVILQPTHDALTRGGRHTDQNNETDPHLDLHRMWISNSNRPPDDQTKGYLQFDLTSITGQVVKVRLRLSKLDGTTLGPVDDRAFLFRSKDMGRTWSDPRLITAGREVNLVQLPGGKLLGCVTLTNNPAERPGVIGLIESDDGGQTWTTPRRVEGLGPAQIPGYPLQLDDGRLLIIYGNRQFPFGVQAIASRDSGRTWATDQPIVLSWFSWDHHCGNPRSVLLPDGRIVTSYYARIFSGIPDGVVYTPTDRDPIPDLVAHCIQWRPPADWPYRK